MFDDTYKTIEQTAEGIFRDRGSKFIAKVFHVRSEKEVKQCLELMRNDFHDARHHCYAYILHPDKSAFRLNDDGEPSGTAGRPIHGQLLSFDLTNVLIVVVRYFGGTLLGVSGLINAYKTAARLAIENTVILEKHISDVYKVTYDYAVTSDVMRILKEYNASFLDQGFEMQCHLSFAVRRNDANAVYSAFHTIKGAKLEFVKTL